MNREQEQIEAQKSRPSKQAERILYFPTKNRRSWLGFLDIFLGVNPMSCVDYL
jgi:hypothetical protein